MKKLIILFSILFLVDTVYGQNTKAVKVDSLVTVSFPAKYVKKDTLGQKIFSANTDLGYMIAISEPNAKGNPPLKKEKDLNSVLKKYVQGIQKQSGDGSAQFVCDTTIGTLKAKAFTLYIKDPNGDNQYRNFIILYTQGATYTFEYGYSETRKDLVKNESKAFFSSIKLSPELQRNDQYMETAPSKSVNTNLIFEIGGGVIVLGLLAWFIFRKKDNSQFA